MKSEKGTSYLEFLLILIIVVLPLSYAVLSLFEGIKLRMLMIKVVLLHPFP